MRGSAGGLRGPFAKRRPLSPCARGAVAVAATVQAQRGRRIARLNSPADVAAAAHALPAEARALPGT